MFYTPMKKPKNIRDSKGNSLLIFPENYVVLDLETTDFDYFFGEIIEIGAKKYEGHNVVEEFITLIKPNNTIDDFTTALTGINNEMVSNAPTMKEVMPNLIEFLGDSIIIAHNANFDINFLYDTSQDLLEIPIKNDFVDTLRLSRWLIKDSENHKLKTLADYFSLEKPKHRVESDINTTHQLYLNLLRIYQENPISFKTTRNKPSPTIDFRKITANIDIEEIDEDNYFFGKEVCFTGKMNIFTKKEASQIIANLGATIQNNVRLSTEILVLGDLQYQIEKFGGKSSKHLKAETMKEDGSEIEIMTELTFLELINQ